MSFCWPASAAADMLTLRGEYSKMTWVLTPFILPIFFVRDFSLLRMGPRSKTSIRLGAYSLVLLASVLFLSTFTSVERRMLDPFMVAMMCLYAALCFLSALARKKDRHDLGWLLAAAPNPLLGLGFLKVAQTAAPRGSQEVLLAGAIVAASLWIALMVYCVKRVDDIAMSVPDLDFSLSVAAVVNSAALLTLVI